MRILANGGYTGSRRNAMSIPSLNKIVPGGIDAAFSKAADMMDTGDARNACECGPGFTTTHKEAPEANVRQLEECSLASYLCRRRFNRHSQGTVQLQGLS